MPRFNLKTTGTKTAGTVVHVPFVFYIALTLIVAKLLMMFFGIGK
jgi:hypothetical protein